MTRNPSPPPFCELRGWVVFRPGAHKAGAFYSPADVRRIAANFARLSAGPDEAAVPLVVKAAIGHDRRQRYAHSLGFPRLGRVAACRLRPDGAVAVDVTGVPTPVGAAVNAGLFDSGSVELADGFPDPADPARTVPGPVLTGVALLGEEQPAVKGFPPPRAVFADGSPVPPVADAAPWLAALAGVPRDRAPDDPMTAGGRRLVLHRILFSEFTPMRDQIIADLQPFGIDAAGPHYAGLTDDQLQAVRDTLRLPALADALRKPAADDAPPWARRLTADLTGCVQRLGGWRPRTATACGPTTPTGRRRTGSCRRRRWGRRCGTAGCCRGTGRGSWTRGCGC